MNLTRPSLQSGYQGFYAVYSDEVVADGCAHNSGGGAADILANNLGASLSSAVAHHADYHDMRDHFGAFAFAILFFWPFGRVARNNIVD